MGSMGRADSAVTISTSRRARTWTQPARDGCGDFDLLGDCGHFTMCGVSRKPSLLDWFSALVLLGTVGVTFSVYERLPDPMPSHFGVSGSADGLMPRPIAAWLLPLAAIGLGSLFRLGQWLMPRQWRPAFRASPVDAIVLVLVTMLSGMHLLILRAALDSKPRLGGAIWVLGGLALIAMGWLMPRTSRNWLFGFKDEMVAGVRRELDARTEGWRSCMHDWGRRDCGPGWARIPRLGVCRTTSHGRYTPRMVLDRSPSRRLRRFGSPSKPSV